MKEKNKTPWIFWINFNIRKSWFSNFWKSRGGNFIELQIWIFKISIGLPWLQNNLDQKISDYGNLNCVKKTNDLNLMQKFSIQIGHYNSKI